MQSQALGMAGGLARDGITEPGLIPRAACIAGQPAPTVKRKAAGWAGFAQRQGVQVTPDSVAPSLRSGAFPPQQLLAHQQLLHTVLFLTQAFLD